MRSVSQFTFVFEGLSYLVDFQGDDSSVWDVTVAGERHAFLVPLRNPEDSALASREVAAFLDLVKSGDRKVYRLIAGLCTWKNCHHSSVHRETGSDGAEWARLCDVHHEQVEDALGGMKPKNLLRTWALAGHHHPVRDQQAKEMAEGARRIVAAFRGMNHG